MGLVLTPTIGTICDLLIRIFINYSLEGLSLVVVHVILISFLLDSLW